MSSPAERPPLSADERRGALLSVFLVVFIDLLGFGIVLPMLAPIGQQIVAPMTGGEETLAAGVLVGILSASFSAMQFLFSPIWGRLSDRVGRRPVLLVGLVGSIAFYSLLGVAIRVGVADQAALGFGLLLLARAGAGIAGATIATAQAVIADATTPDRRSKGMALIGVAFGMGFTFGPALGAAIMRRFPDHPEAVGFGAAIMSLAAFGIAMIRLPETRGTGSAEHGAHGAALTRLLAAFRLANVGPLIVAFFLTTLAFTQFEVNLGLLNEVMGFVKEENYVIYAGVGLVLIFATGGLYRRMAGHVPDGVLLRLGVAGIALGQASLAALGLFSDGAGVMRLSLFFTGLVFSTVGYSFINPSVQALVSRWTAPVRQGEVLGVNQSAASLARVVGPAIGPPLFALGARHSWPFILATLLLIAVLVLLSRLQDPDDTITR